jgi:hypothetical protein
VASPGALLVSLGLQRVGKLFSPVIDSWFQSEQKPIVVPTEFVLHSHCALFSEPKSSGSAETLCLGPIQLLSHFKLPLWVICSSHALMMGLEGLLLRLLLALSSSS